MSEFWSAAATRAAKEKGGLVRYRSYRKGTYFDKISERYNFVDIFELQAFHVPLDMEKITWYKENVKEPLITPSGEDGHIIALSREAFYADQQEADHHVVVPVQLKVRRFKFVTDGDLQLWEEESKEEGITFIGSISGIVPVREILENNAEDGLIHQATSDRDEQIRQMMNSDGALLKTPTTEDPSFFYNYEEHFTPVGPCGHFECPICYGSLILFDKPRIFLLGYPEDAPEVITVRVKDAKTKKLKHLLKLAKLSQISLMLSEMMDSADAIDNLSLSDYYENMS